MRQRLGDPIDQVAHTNQPTKEISNFLAKNNGFCILSLSKKKKNQFGPTPSPDINDH
jgi:hypothetical protein